MGGLVYIRYFYFERLVRIKIFNKTKVLSVQLGKTLGLTTVPITETRETNNLYDYLPAMVPL